MDSKTFLAESERTLSSQFHDEIVPPAFLKAVMEAAIDVGNTVDEVKKSLFYGRALSEDLAVEAAVHAGPAEGFDPRRVDPLLLHGAFGVLGEAVEILEALDKAMRGGEVDRVNLMEEVGDVEWFLAIFYRFFEKLPEDVREVVIAKLRKRYPQKFTSEAAITRDLAGERALLEAHAGNGPDAAG